MPKENCQKIKLLKLYEMLLHETDPEHPMKTNEICSSLADMGITCDRRTLSNDIKTLNENGYDIAYVQIGHDKGYYINKRDFSVSEVRLLIDLVKSANFLDNRTAKALSYKIAELTDPYSADTIIKNTLEFDPFKYRDNEILEKVESIVTALKDGLKLEFKYFKLDEKKNKIYQNNGEIYKATPVNLSIDSGRYYFIGRKDGEDQSFTFRIDRMDEVRTSAEFGEKAENSRDEEGQIFKMYHGITKTVRLRFRKEAIGSVYDRFGDKATIIKDEIPDKDGEETYTTTVNAQISPTFWGWMFQFVGKMEILPLEKDISTDSGAVDTSQELRDEYVEQIKKVFNSLQSNIVGEQK